MIEKERGNSGFPCPLTEMKPPKYENNLSIDMSVINAFQGAN